MDEMPGGRRRVLANTEQGYLVSHAGGAELADAQPGIDGTGVFQSAMKTAHRLDGETDCRARVNIEPADRDQVLIDDRVEERVIDHIVDMAIEIIVHPACGDGEEMRKALPPLLRRLGHQKRSGIKGSPASPPRSPADLRPS